MTAEIVSDYENNYITGWVKLYRSLKDKSWFKKAEHLQLWIYLLIDVNHKGKEGIFFGDPIKLNPGQTLTGRKKIAEETGINESKVERILTYFEKKEQQIEQQKSNKNRIITVLNWYIYQQSEQQLNNNRTTTEQQLNTNKNDNNKKNDNKNIIPEKSFSDDVIFLANYFSKTLSDKLIPKNQTSKTKWLDALDKCIRLDGYSKEQIMEIIDYFRNDSFWSNNFLSPAKLRTKNKEDIKYIDLFWQKLSNNGEYGAGDKQQNLMMKLSDKFYDMRNTEKYPDDATILSYMQKFGYKKPDLKKLKKYLQENGVELTGSFKT